MDIQHVGALAQTGRSGIKTGQWLSRAQVIKA